MRLRNLNSFIKVASSGSFHAAANLLHTSQPAISSRITALEEELGVKLFQRDQSGTHLTTRGMQLLPYAEKLIAISNEMKAQLQDKSPAEGLFRIGIADTMAHMWLSDLLKIWRQHYPLIQFELTIDLTRGLYQQLLHHQLDLALMVSVSQEGISTQPLCQYSQSWVTSPQFANDNTVSNLHQLADLPILSFPVNTGPGEHIKHLISNFTLSPKLHISNSVAGLLTMAKQGAGVALLTDPVVNKAIEKGQLVRLDIAPTPPPLQFCSGWRRDEDRILPKLLADSAGALMHPQDTITTISQSSNETF